MTSVDLPVLAPGTPLGSPSPRTCGTRTAPEGARWRPGLASPVVGPSVLATAV